MLRDEFRSKKARRELSKNIYNLDGSAPITGTEGSRPAEREVGEKEFQARWDLAFGKITQEEFDDLKESGELDES
tara:strand:- start:831 stop:1055 length:225 start_codon:yes stop_codon:yes gene_type:complete